MARSYGKQPKKSSPSASRPKTESTALKIKLRRKDDAPLTIKEVQQALQEAARMLPVCGAARAKRAMIYIRLIDEEGKEMRVNEKNEWTVTLYSSAAEERGL